MKLVIANKAYAYDLSVPEIAPQHMPNKKDFKIIKTPKKVLKQNMEYMQLLEIMTQEKHLIK